MKYNFTPNTGDIGKWGFTSEGLPIFKCMLILLKSFVFLPDCTLKCSFYVDEGCSSYFG